MGVAYVARRRQDFEALAKMEQHINSVIRALLDGE